MPDGSPQAARIIVGLLRVPSVWLNPAVRAHRGLCTAKELVRVRSSDTILDTLKSATCVPSKGWGSALQLCSPQCATAHTASEGQTDRGHGSPHAVLTSMRAANMHASAPTSHLRHCGARPASLSPPAPPPLFLLRHTDLDIEVFVHKQIGRLEVPAHR